MNTRRSLTQLAYSGPDHTIYSIFFSYRLLSNYENCDGGLTAVKDIIRDAETVKKNPYCSANSSLLGQLVRQLWGEKVKMVKRGSRNQRQNFYLNLQKKVMPDGGVVEPSMSGTSLSTLKKGWLLVNDHDTFLSFIRCESWSFRNETVSVEVKVEKDNGLNPCRYSIASHGCQMDLKDFIDINFLEKHPLRERLEMILTTVETSTLCRGVQIKDVEFSSTMPHESGIYEDNSTQTAGKRAFSSTCTIICSAGQQCCTQCQNLNHNIVKRSKRKMETGGVIHHSTNKRYLSKEEIATQLHQERQKRLNAERREKKLRETFEAECVEMTDEDHADLSIMFQGANNIPEHMSSLWEQQQKLLACKSKNAYRWHPK